MLAVVGDHLLVPTDRKPPRDAQVHIGIRRSIYRRIETTNRGENGPPVHYYRGHPDIVALQQRSVAVFIDNGLPPLLEKRSIARDNPVRAEGDRTLRIG